MRASGIAIRPLSSAAQVLGSRALLAARRRIPPGDAARTRHLDVVVDTFRTGYSRACQLPDAREVISSLSEIDGHLQGFAFEGAAMAFALVDAISPWRRPRLPLFIDLAERHVYVVHVGVGWALARGGSCEGRTFGRLDPLLRWLALDGAGFHDGYTHVWHGQAPLRRRGTLSVYGARAFDHGLGRSLWFTTIADPHRIAATIALAEPSRRPDLWSGIGLACAYAGGVTASEIAALGEACGRLRPHLAQGVAFAAEAHVRASGSAPPHTELAAQLLCGLPADAAARAAREAAIGLSSEHGEPEYETWRHRLRSRFREEIS